MRKGKAAASAVRVVTVLGATGSIGDSTMDLLRASPDRYQVEALTAHTNVPALAKLAKEFGARFAAIVHHTDATREYAYDRTSKIGKLDKALDEANSKGWTVIDMQKDWNTMFVPVSAQPTQPTQPAQTK